jgi:hypothetical protein
LQHNEKQEALTLNKGISKSSTTQLWFTKDWKK